MPDRDTRFLIEDMLEYSRRAQSYVAGSDFDAFEQAGMIQDAVIRCLEVIGEAARSVPAEVRAQAPNVPWGQIVAARHIFAHHYGKVDLEQVWRVVMDRLPELVPALEMLLAKQK